MSKTHQYQSDVSHLITSAQVDIRVAIMEDTAVPMFVQHLAETALVHQGLANKLHKIGENDSFQHQYVS